MKPMHDSDYWLAKLQPGYVVYDADGWDRQNFEESWSELITAEEFLTRFMQSTVMYMPE